MEIQVVLIHHGKFLDVLAALSARSISSHARAVLSSAARILTRISVRVPLSPSVYGDLNEVYCALCLERGLGYGDHWTTSLVAAGL